MTSLPVRALPDSSLEPLPPPPRGARAPASEIHVEALAASDPRIDGLRQFRGALYEDWRRLWAALSPAERDPMTHPAWLSSWFVHRAPGMLGEHRLLVARSEDGELIAVLPVRVERCRPGCRLVLDTGLESGTIATRDQDRAALVDSIFRATIPDFGRPRSLLLARVDGTNLLLRGDRRQLVDLLSPRSLINVAGGHDALMDRWSGNFRSSLRRAHKKLAKLGEVRIDNLTRPDEMHDGLARFARVDALSWKSEGGEIMVEDLSLRRMLAVGLPALAAEGAASVQVLSVDRRDVAAQVSLLVDDVLHVLKMSFDGGHRHAAPGNVLFDETLHHIAPKLGASWVSLVAGLGWHERWRPWPLASARVWYFAPGLRGLVGRLFDVPPRLYARRTLLAAGIDPAPIAAWIRSVRKREQS